MILSFEEFKKQIFYIISNYLHVDNVVAQIISDYVQVDWEDKEEITKMYYSEEKPDFYTMPFLRMWLEMSEACKDCYKYYLNKMDKSLFIIYDIE